MNNVTLCVSYTRQSRLEFYRSLVIKSAVVSQICAYLLILWHISITLTDFSNVALKKKKKGIKAIHTLLNLYFHLLPAYIKLPCRNI